VLYNRITTPRGGQYRLVLPDGTRVWLNSASSIRFPTRFDGHERKVELMGEGYFEVAKNASKPFRVAFAGSGEVEVLGTHFNINAYEDEPSLKVTLLEGSVRVRSAGDSKVLQPDEQAVISGASAAISVQKGIDVNQVVSWKDDLFDFNNDPLPAVMRQLSRWYDADISYRGIIPEGHYTGSIRRQASLSEVLRMLELAGGVHFSIEKKQIVVEKRQS
jgi:transmembrane sensor